MHYFIFLMASQNKESIVRSSTRRQNKDKTEDLRRSIQHVLDEMASLREDSESRYNEYIYQLKKILPLKEESSIPAEVIAAHLSNDKDEQRSIRASLRGLAYVAEHRQYLDSFSALPTLKTSRRTTTRHFAELNDEGCTIRQWDVEKSTTTYYLDQKKG